MNKMDEEDQYDNDSHIETRSMPQDASILQYRLDTSPTIKELEVTLTGKKKDIVVADDNTVKEITIKVSDPKCNDQGTRSILTYVKIFANPQTLTGNIREDSLGEYIANRRREVLRDLGRNQYNYGIKTSNFSNIIDNIMNCIYIELTHAVGAGTRNSISQSSRITETVGGHQQNKGFMGGLFKR